MNNFYTFLICASLSAIIVNADGQCIIDYPDVQVVPSNIQQSEVHISVNPNNGNDLILSFNSMTSPSSDRQGYAFSVDGGNTWSGSNYLQNNISTIGDPMTAFDANGTEYIGGINYNFSIAQITGIFLQSSTNNGTTWNNFISPSATGDVEKDMLSIDNFATSPYKNYIYSGWRQNSTDHPAITHLIPGGQSFTNPPYIFNQNYGNGVNIQTGTNGHVYICWEDLGTSDTYPGTGIGFAVSIDGGKSFSQATIPFSITGMDPNGFGGDPKFNNIRVWNFPSMAVDKSCTHPGRIYIVYPEEVSGKSVIQLSYSDDEGSHWSPSITVSEPSFGQSFFPWIAVDNTNGDIYIDYYAFDQSSGFSTDTYVAYSNNGGSSFCNVKVSDVAHITQPISDNYAGDYIGIAAYGGQA